jgi:hypothetical protein
MKKKDIEVGKVYCAKVSGKLAPVRIVSESAYGGWNATNITTGRSVKIKTAQRLRYRMGNGHSDPTVELEQQSRGGD